MFRAGYHHWDKLGKPWETMDSVTFGLGTTTGTSSTTHRKPWETMDSITFGLGNTTGTSSGNHGKPWETTGSYNVEVGKTWETIVNDGKL